MTHLYAGAGWTRGPVGRIPIAKAACGLRKAFVFDRPPSDVVTSLGAVTCPECLAKAQEGKKTP